MKFAKVIDVTFYMKSGNVIVADSVGSQALFTPNGNSIGKIEKYQQISPKNSVAVQLIDLSQIEGISFTKMRSKLIWK